jgi:hypothetical protein
MHAPPLRSPLRVTVQEKMPWPREGEGARMPALGAVGRSHTDRRHAHWRRRLEAMPGMDQPCPAAPVDTAYGHPQVLDRVRRWAAATDLRVVERLWPRQPDGAERALCLVCGGAMRDGMLITLNQMAPYFPAGPAYQALAAGDVEPLTPDLPIEPGELWCVVCLPCLEGGGLTQRLQALVDEALQSD